MIELLSLSPAAKSRSDRIFLTDFTFFIDKNPSALAIADCQALVALHQAINQQRCKSWAFRPVRDDRVDQIDGRGPAIQSFEVLFNLKEEFRSVQSLPYDGPPLSSGSGDVSALLVRQVLMLHT